MTGPRTLCFESMTVLQIGPWKVRIWRTEASAATIDRSELRVERDALLERSDQPMPNDIIEAFAAVPRVAAVEVTNADGWGIVAYVDWPE